MKKVFFLIAFLFTVVCYAAPPPDKLTSFLSEDVGVIRSQSDFDVHILEVQEVANDYTGDIEIVSYQVLLMEQKGMLEFPKLVMSNSYYNYKEEINRPPENNIIIVPFLINNIRITVST